MPNERGHPATLKPPWQKGQSGNPKGHKRGAVNLTSIIKRVLKEVSDDPKAQGKTYAELLCRAGIKQAAGGNGPWVKQIFDRIDGPVPNNDEDRSDELKQLVDAMRTGANASLQPEAGD